MALGATMFRFALDVSDIDRGQYVQEELVVARHPSENDASMISRVLAWALHYEPGTVLGRGLAFPDEAAVAVPDGRGGIALWVEVGMPTAERLHRAAKLADRVVVYVYRDPQILLHALKGERIHNPERLRIVPVPPVLMTALEARLDRRNPWSIVRTEGNVYLTVGSDTLEWTPEALTLG